MPTSEGHYIHITDVYTFFYYERGEKSIIIETSNENELFYTILKKVIINFSIEQTKLLEVDFEDSRRIWMEKSLKLMLNVNEKFYNKLNQEFIDILKAHPFDDKNATRLVLIDKIFEVIKGVKPLVVKSRNATVKKLLKDLEKAVRSVLKKNKYVDKNLEIVSEKYERFFVELLSSNINISSDIMKNAKAVKEKGCIHFTNIG